MKSEVEPIMREGVFGPRRILPASMWVGLTRYAEGGNGSSTHRARAAAGFVLSSQGIWLPKIEHAQVDLNKFKGLVTCASPDQLLLSEEGYEITAEATRKVGLTDTGCWHSDDASPQLLHTLTEVATSRKILETNVPVERLNQCGNPACVYHRHFDFTLDVPSGRRALLYPNLNYFYDTPDRVITAWGDTLPSIEESTRALVDLQRRCAPYVDDGDSLLTIGSISQLSLIPGTGCWFARSYYMTPVGVDGYDNWQYDGYGRLTIPKNRAEKVNYASFAILGHRAVWKTLGHPTSNPREKVLNHKCGFRPCANPGHLIEVPQQVNNQHGQVMKKARQMMEGVLPVELGIDYLAHHAQLMGNDPNNVADFWTHHLSDDPDK